MTCPITSIMDGVWLVGTCWVVVPLSLIAGFPLYCAGHSLIEKLRGKGR